MSRADLARDSSASSGAPRINNIQHSAYRCRDAEQTRWFYEDILGLPLVSALAVARSEGNGEQVTCMHIFFEMGDGNCIAFFDEPDHAEPSDFDKKHGFDLHVAFETHDMDSLRVWEERYRKAGISFDTIDHGFLHSIYCYDPNGIRVEITCKTKDYDKHMAEERNSAHAAVAAWTEQTRALKDKRLGAGTVASRSHLSAELPPL